MNSNFLPNKFYNTSSLASLGSGGTNTLKTPPTEKGFEEAPHNPVIHSNAKHLSLAEDMLNTMAVRKLIEDRFNIEPGSYKNQQELEEKLVKSIVNLIIEFADQYGMTMDVAKNTMYKREKTGISLVMRAETMIFSDLKPEGTYKDAPVKRDPSITENELGSHVRKYELAKKWLGLSNDDCKNTNTFFEAINKIYSKLIPAECDYFNIPLERKSEYIALKTAHFDKAVDIVSKTLGGQKVSDAIAAYIKKEEEQSKTKPRS